MDTSFTLTNESLLEGVEYLGRVDVDLAKVIQELGPPPLWGREPGFATLVYIILEQQVSLASAKAAFEKLQKAIEPLFPQEFLKLSDSELKTIGFSRQKAGYCRGLAAAILEKKIDLEAIQGMDDHSARAALMDIKGVGRWTADIYLLMVMLRPDIWPTGDLALVTGAQELKGFSARLSQEEMKMIAVPWRPWRSVAARLIWASYLHRRNNYHP